MRNLCVTFAEFVVIDERRSFGQHVVAAMKKKDRKLRAISRIMPNVGKPRTVQYCTMSLYTERSSGQKRLKSESTCRTVSTLLLQVITGIIPVDLMAQEKGYLMNSEGWRRAQMTEAIANSCRI
ncbi:hypothetical protein QE152_g28544 [Popillia japonica]|uniref:Uncharacterized protein n=1 Tax=Popillia japonica TaxID=7064 RepID=A0AAW1JJG3_POPJA